LSRIIKSSIALEASGGVRVREANLDTHLVTVDDRVAEMLDKARTQADMIVRTARAEADGVLTQARDEGLRQGLEQAAERSTQLIARLESELAELDAARRALIDSTESDLLKLCVGIVEKIVRHEVRTSPAVVLRTVKSCLRRLKDAGEITVRVSPSEIEAVKAERDALLDSAGGARGIHIVDDRRIEAGGCVLEAASGDLDARIATQITQIEKKLTETFDDDRASACSESDQIQQEDSRR